MKNTTTVVMMGLTAAMGLGLTACNGIKGTLTVSKPLTLVNSKGKSVTAEGGQHATELKISPAGNELTLRIKNVAGKKQKIDIKLPAGEILPREQGSITIKGSEVGQPVDIRASLATEVTRTPLIRESISCQIREIAQECRTIPVDDGNGRRHLERRCENVELIHQGFREVDSHTVITETGAHADFVEPATGQIIADFSGAQSSSQNIIDFEGPCILQR